MITPIWMSLWPVNLQIVRAPSRTTPPRLTSFPIPMRRMSRIPRWLLEEALKIETLLTIKGNSTLSTAKDRLILRRKNHRVEGQIDPKHPSNISIRELNPQKVSKCGLSWAMPGIPMGDLKSRAPHRIKCREWVGLPLHLPAKQACQFPYLLGMHWTQFLGLISFRFKRINSNNHSQTCTRTLPRCPPTPPELTQSMLQCREVILPKRPIHTIFIRQLLRLEGKAIWQDHLSICNIILRAILDICRMENS